MKSNNTKNLKKLKISNTKLSLLMVHITHYSDRKIVHAEVLLHVQCLPVFLQMNGFSMSETSWSISDEQYHTDRQTLTARQPTKSVHRQNNRGWWSACWRQQFNYLDWETAAMHTHAEFDSVLAVTLSSDFRPNWRSCLPSTDPTWTALPANRRQETC